MNVILRKALPGDEQAFMSIKKQLPLMLADGTSSTGGFLLGTDEQTYKDYISTCYCLVAELRNEVVGFGIVFPDNVLRQSDIWIRRHSAKWETDLTKYEPQQLCYFEQFAFLRGYKRTAVLLAYNLVKWAFDKGAESLVTTTVNKPVLNLAAIPFIKAADGIKAGNIDETYPVIGHINSDVYIVDGATFFKRANEHPLNSFLQANTLTLA